MWFFLVGAAGFKVIKIIGGTLSHESLNNSSFFVWFLVWKTKWGYEMRAVGHNTQAAIYAGISPYKNIIIAMAITLTT